MSGAEQHRLLRWYPVEWRRRYGEEMLAMIEDTTGGNPPSRQLRAGLAIHGAKERLRHSALLGSDRDPTQRSRGGARVILGGWAALAIAGCAFAKFSEHWSDHTPVVDRAVATAAYLGVQLLAGLGAGVVVLAMIAALPAFRRAIATGAWPSLRGTILRATSLTLLLAAVTVGLATWAHSLSTGQRNGGSLTYTLAFLAAGGLFVATVAAWAAAALKVEKSLHMSATLARIEWVAAALMALIILAISLAIMVWWVDLAIHAPWVLSGEPPGTPSTWWSWTLGLIALLTAAASAAALTGATALIRAARHGM